MKQQFPIRIGACLVGPSFPPFVIAELSGNHNGSLERGLAIVDAAAAAGAHAIKLQTYTADTMTIDVRDREFLIEDSGSLWKGRSLYELYQAAHTPWEWHAPLFSRARERGLVAFSTPFDATAIDFLESLGVPCYKIASFEIVDLPLIDKAAATGKPVIISTGMATLDEIDEAVRTARQAGCKDLTLLKCTSSYPASPVYSNLMTIPHLAKTFGCNVGISDHTLGIGAALTAVALGATVIEKHFTLNRSDGGIDSAFSLEPDELKLLVEESRRSCESLGKVHFGPTEPERSSLVFRRSLYIVRDMKAGERLSAQNLRAIRPGNGLAPKYLAQLLGMPVTDNVRKGTPMSWRLVKTG